MTRYREDLGRNVTQILVQGTRVIRGTIPRAVRSELMAAVKLGALGRLKKDGLKPEIFYHPDSLHGAVDRQKREAMYAVQCIASVIAVKPVEQRVEEAFAEVARRAERCRATTPTPEPAQ